MRKILFLVFLTTLLSCQDNVEGEGVSTIKIRLGEAGSSFLQRNNLASNKHVDKQPAGLNFYEHHWGANHLGNVIVDDPSHGFSIPYARSVLGTEDSDQLEAGIQKFSINAGINADALIEHDKARLEFYQLLQQLEDRGWKPFIAYDEPRLTGEDAFKYYLENRYYNSSINYVPAIEEWMNMHNARWHFYAGNIFLDIVLRRDSKRMSLSEPGAYLISFTLRTPAQKAQSQFPPEDIAQWQELWVEKIKSFKQIRYSKEAELSKRGFIIHTQYEEPRIHPADPVEL